MNYGDKMKEIEKKTFWVMPHMKVEQRTSRVMEKWKPDKDIALVGARVILLTDQCMQETIDIYGAVTKNPKVKYQHDDLKKDHLFYGQRDCYTRCSGMKDLILLDYLPTNYYFKVFKGETIYFKALANKGIGLEGDYDVLIDLFYIPLWRV